MLCLLCAAVELGQYASLDYLDYLLIIRTVTGTGSEGAGLAAVLGQCGSTVDLNCASAIEDEGAGEREVESRTRRLVSSERTVLVALRAQQPSSSGWRSPVVFPSALTVVLWS